MKVVLSGQFTAKRGLNGGDIPNLLKVTIVEGEEVFVLIVQTLDIVGNALGEVPYVSGLEYFSSEAAVLVNAREK
jgi:hypothetical protein